MADLGQIEKETQRLVADAAYRHVPDTLVSKVAVIRVFTGGADGMQSIPFTTAIQALKSIGSHFVVQKMNIKTLKDMQMSPADLIDWMLDSDVHLVLSHIHQGFSGKNEHQLGWNMNDLAHEVRRLTDHPGFPNGRQLLCPVFTQNKYTYISAIPDFCNPTFSVRINEHCPSGGYHSPELQQ